VINDELFEPARPDQLLSGKSVLAPTSPVVSPNHTPSSSVPISNVSDEPSQTQALEYQRRLSVDYSAELVLQDVEKTIEETASPAFQKFFLKNHSLREGLFEDPEWKEKRDKRVQEMMRKYKESYLNELGGTSNLVSPKSSRNRPSPTGILSKI
jgi:hypothetical protein